MVESIPSLFLEGLRQLGLDEQDKHMLAQFAHYCRELLEWNTRFNLTAIKDPQEVWIRHFLDSLSLLTVYDRPEARVLDIGSGAGFPGIPLKIVRPAWHITLLEATGKRVTFLRHIVETLQLEHVTCVQGRAEELAHRPEYRGAFDLVTARAVASLAQLLEYAAPFTRVGGVIIFPKKGELAAELAQGKRAAHRVGAVLQNDAPVNLPGLADGRRLLVWEQQQMCPQQYPRSGAAMAKRPLG
ncbi:MAG: 16S rRNA (guanine(527)-N(7))-methyltransferase RsmG [Ktedonobacteraceae bacterium]|nr:16S rRNA (guanine(527)-N(7))-methyltransferase RsmG [Ktedonobacteraceae bacterium]